MTIGDKYTIDFLVKPLRMATLIRVVWTSKPLTKQECMLYFGPKTTEGFYPKLRLSTNERLVFKYDDEQHGYVIIPNIPRNQAFYHKI